MSRWAPDPTTLTRPEGESVSAPSEAGSSDGLKLPRQPASARWWGWLISLFGSAAMFLSAIFAVFAPFPILIRFFLSGRRWAWLAALANTAVVWLAAGPVSAAIYVVLVASLALGLSEFLSRKQSVERSVAATLLVMALTGGLILGIYSQIHHLHPMAELKQQVSASVDFLSQSAPNGTWSNGTDMDEWKHNLLVEFPSALAVFSLILVWANLMLVLRLNPMGIREKLGLEPAFFRKWKAPEVLVWPAIASGIFLIWDAGSVSEVALNVFKFLMAVYAIQGLSILSFFFDVWNIRGFFRAIAFLAAIFLMMPLLLSLGFFDLWFDFRSKFRQS